MRGVSNDIILLLIITQLWRIKVRIDKVKANQKKKSTSKRMYTTFIAFYEFSSNRFYIYLISQRLVCVKEQAVIQPVLIHRSPQPRFCATENNTRSYTNSICSWSKEHHLVNKNSLRNQGLL